MSNEKEMQQLIKKLEELIVTKKTTIKKEKDKLVVELSGGINRVKFPGYANRKLLIKELSQKCPYFEFTEHARRSPDIFLVPVAGIEPSPHKSKIIKEKKDKLRIMTLEEFWHVYCP